MVPFLKVTLTLYSSRLYWNNQSFVNNLLLVVKLKKSCNIFSNGKISEIRFMVLGGKSCMEIKEKQDVI